VLQTMPDLKWRVRLVEGDGVWNYTFSHSGSVSWVDPWHKSVKGNGDWRIVKNKLIIHWHTSGYREEWDVPIFPLHATGRVYWPDGPQEFVAEATNWYLQPGDVVYGVGDPVIFNTGGARACIIYPDEVRIGGSIAWLTRNPGNIREGEKYGAYPGKRLHVGKIGSYSIFPDEDTGMMAIVKVLRVYGRVTIRQAIEKYAPKTDGNTPENYISTVVKKTKYKESSVLTDMSDEQLLIMAKAMSGEEFVKEGKPLPRDSYKLPSGIRPRLLQLSQPTEDAG